MKGQDWAIRKCWSACCLCGEKFADRQQFFSSLQFGENGYERTDCCRECWPRVEGEQAVSTWRGVFRTPPPPRPEAVKRKTAESLLRRYMEVEDHSRRPAIFILAVMLERKRILRERNVQEREDGVTIRIYEHTGTGEMFMVPDPRLKLSELESVRDDVLAMLGASDPGGSQDVGLSNTAK